MLVIDFEFCFLNFDFFTATTKEGNSLLQYFREIEVQLNKIHLSNIFENKFHSEFSGEFSTTLTLSARMFM